MSNKVMLEKAAIKFIEKVESGRARSIETYREFKEAMNTEEELDTKTLLIDFWNDNDNVRNWTEDYEQENGFYQCKCYKCKEYFIGNKHRIVCKKCANDKEK